jgi:hypothetical protein
MITPERLAAYKKQAIASVAARAKNQNAPGVTCISVSPLDLLDLILSFEEATAPQEAAQANDSAAPAG